MLMTELPLWAFKVQPHGDSETHLGMATPGCEEVGVLLSLSGEGPSQELLTSSVQAKPSPPASGQPLGRETQMLEI